MRWTIGRYLKEYREPSRNTTSVVTLDTSATAGDGLRLLARANILSAPVVDTESLMVRELELCTKRKKVSKSSPPHDSSREHKLTKGQRCPLTDSVTDHPPIPCHSSLASTTWEISCRD